jgi:hypothetical protein
LETLVAILLAQSEQHPVLFIVEDLHWTDPTTLELLNLVIDQTPTAYIFVLLTCRPMFQPSWTHRSYLSEVSVTRLAQAQVAHIVERVAGGKTLPHEVMQLIVEKTDGVPLFVEEMPKAILESGHLKETDGHYALTGSLSTFAIPTTLQDSLMARLDRLVLRFINDDQVASDGLESSGTYGSCTLPIKGMHHMPGPVPTFCPIVPEDFLRQARLELRRKTAPHQSVQRYQVAVLLHQEPHLPHEEAGRRVGLAGCQGRRWRKRWAAGDFAVVDAAGRGRKAVFSPAGPRVGQGSGL